MAPRSALGLGLAFAVACAGCGSNATPRPTTIGAGPSTSAAAPAAFTWLGATAPSGWPVLAIPSGAALTYPPGWRRVHGDLGTVTVIRYSPTGHILGYLNLTPRQGNERLTTFPSFRLSHNADEGDRHVRRLASATGLAFATGRGSCVEDSYTTVSAAHYLEIACLVTGRRTSSVIVGAAPPGAWRQISPLIERAIASVRT